MRSRNREQLLDRLYMSYIHSSKINVRELTKRKSVRQQIVLINLEKLELKEYSKGVMFLQNEEIHS